MRLLPFRALLITRMWTGLVPRRVDPVEPTAPDGLPADGSDEKRRLLPASAVPGVKR